MHKILLLFVILQCIFCFSLWDLDLDAQEKTGMWNKPSLL